MFNEPLINLRDSWRAELSMVGVCKSSDNFASNSSCSLVMHSWAAGQISPFFQPLLSMPTKHLHSLVRSVITTTTQQNSVWNKSMLISVYNKTGKEIWKCWLQCMFVYIHACRGNTTCHHWAGAHFIRARCHRVSLRLTFCTSPIKLIYQGNNKNRK